MSLVVSATKKSQFNFFDVYPRLPVLKKRLKTVFFLSLTVFSPFTVLPVLLLLLFPAVQLCNHSWSQSVSKCAHSGRLICKCSPTPPFTVHTSFSFFTRSSHSLRLSNHLPAVADDHQWIVSFKTAAAVHQHWLPAWFAWIINWCGAHQQHCAAPGNCHLLNWSPFCCVSINYSVMHYSDNFKVRCPLADKWPVVVAVDKRSFGDVPALVVCLSINTRFFENHLYIS